MTPTPGPAWSVAPRDWRAIEDYDTWTDPYTPNDAIALHHGGGSDYKAHSPPYSRANEIQQLQQWEGFHIYGRGWRGLAYGWALGQTGTVYRARGWNTYGAHTGDMDADHISNNREVIPVLFIGSGLHARLSPAAQDSLARLRRYFEDVSGRPLTLYGHREVSLTDDGEPKTSCPGPLGMEYVTTHRVLQEEDMPLTDEEITKIRNAILLAPIGNSGKNLAQHLQNTYQLVKQVAQGRTITEQDVELLEAQFAETFGWIERDTAA